MSGAAIATSVGVAAATAATATSTLGTAFAIASGVGAIATTVGRLTGVKPLQYAGMGLSAVGGIGSLASSAGLLGGEAAGAAGAAGAEGPGGAVAPAVQPSMAPMALDMPTADVVGQINGVPTAPAVPDAPKGAGLIDTPVIPQGGGEGGTLGSIDNPAASPSSGTGLIDKAPPAPVAAGATTAPEPLKPAMPNAENLISAPATGGIAKAGDANIWSKIVTFAEKNPTLIGGMMTAGASFLSGAMDPTKPAQVAALEARTNLDNAQTEVLQRRARNNAQGIPKASNKPRGGLINSTGVST